MMIKRDRIVNRRQGLLNEEPPEEVLIAQGLKSPVQNGKTSLKLFVSFDIVNSTVFKTKTIHWPYIINKLLDVINSQIISLGLSDVFLWRVIGDELIYIIQIPSQKVLQEYIQSLFKVTQRIALSLKDSSFYDEILSEKTEYEDLNLHELQSVLSLKTAAWIAAVNTDSDNNFGLKYNCIQVEYPAGPNNDKILEFLGSDIDTGFRLKEYTNDRRMVISYELAYLLGNENSNLYIMSYEKLKGVWDNHPYPIIWYYNSSIMQKMYPDSAETFLQSFQYDEGINNPMAKKYLERIGNHKQSSEHEYMGEVNMFKPESALGKILRDRNLKEKIEYFESLYQKEATRR